MAFCKTAWFSGSVQLVHFTGESFFYAVWLVGAAAFGDSLGLGVLFLFFDSGHPMLHDIHYDLVSSKSPILLGMPSSGPLKE
jgi:hypothetical protein